MTTDTRLGALDSVLDEAMAHATTERSVVGRVADAVQGSPSGVVGRVVDAVRSGPSESDTSRLGEDLFAVVDALESSPSLRRAVTDPGRPEQNRQQLVHAVLNGKVSKTAVDIVAEGAAMRWAGGRTYAAALERQGARATLMAAESADQLENTEDELFRFARLVDGNPGLRNALADRSVRLAHRQELVGSLLAGKASDATIALAKRAVAARERTFGQTIEGYVTLAAAQKNRIVATVRVATPLTDEQRERLQRTLRNQVGRDVAIQEVIDENVVGGVRVELGDEVIEGTVASRLHDVRRLFS
ncbi:MAG TPA: F0F1 ATP synthase subunit delta [Propionibacteriaceae bacterium]|nr:F0F1 ATP synthase subunit delta [Propionibacteriaceae bacterium]